MKEIEATAAVASLGRQITRWIRCPRRAEVRLLEAVDRVVALAAEGLPLPLQAQRGDE